MQRTSMLILLFSLPAMASAGELYGKITADGATVGAGISVAAKCGTKAYPAVQTDATGSFHLVVDEAGKCTLTVTRNGQSASLDVVSYEEGAQADIVLDTKDNKLSARRK